MDLVLLPLALVLLLSGNTGVPPRAPVIKEVRLVGRWLLHVGGVAQALWGMYPIRVSCIFPPRPPPALLSRATAYARLHTLDTFRIHAYPGGTQIPQHPPLASRSQATGVRQRSRDSSRGVAAAELSLPPARSAASRASVRHALARSRARARTHTQRHTACCMRILSHVPAFRPRKKSCTRASTCTSTASPSQKATCSASWCRNVMLSGPPWVI